jgi:hypothetical protein
MLLSAMFLLLFASCGTEAVRTLEPPEVRPAPEIAVLRADAESAETSAEDIKIGGFERPERVPEYAVIERKENGRDGVRALRLLVDTKASSEAAYELIARDLKAKHSDYDAVSAEVTDTTRGFDYNGAILIFNTPEGSYHMGFLYSPPSNRGYIVDVAKE